MDNVYEQALKMNLELCICDHNKNRERDLQINE